MYDYDFTYNDFMENCEYAEDMGFAFEFEDYDEFIDMLDSYGC